MALPSVPPPSESVNHQTRQPIGSSTAPDSAIDVVDATSATVRSARRSRFTASGVATLVSIVLIAIVSAVVGWRHFYYESHSVTDDAYITGHPHIVSSRIDGVVEEVTVDDNDHVEKGQTVVKLDPHDYKVALEKAEAKLAEAKRAMAAAQQTVDVTAKHAGAQEYNANGEIDAAKASIATAEASVVEARESLEAAKADVQQADAQLVRAKLDYDRFVPLEARGVVSTHEKDMAVRDYDVARAAKEAVIKRLSAAVAHLQEKQHEVVEAHAQLTRAVGSQEQARSDQSKTEATQKQYQVATAAVKEAQAEVDDAKLKLYYCNIYAPVTGHIGKRTVEVGHHIDPGQQLVTVVEDYVWVVANFKETQIRHMEPGQRAKIRVDGIPDHVFTGVVDSFSPGSGSTFSLIPPDNATGNFTKIVQRVPVKIRFDADSAKGFQDKLIVGMSVVADVDTNSHPAKDLLNRERDQDNPLKKIMPYFW